MGLGRRFERIEDVRPVRVEDTAEFNYAELVSAFYIFFVFDIKK